MKKFIFLLTFVVLMLGGVSLVGAKGKEEGVDNLIKASHKIRNKWDLYGSFVGDVEYEWDEVPLTTPWTYKIHVKEALDGDASTGTIHLINKGAKINIVGHVENTYGPDDWTLVLGEHKFNMNEGAEIGADGWAKYNGESYYFMFMHGKHSMRFSLIDHVYSSNWPISTYPWEDLIYHIQSPIEENIFQVTAREIH